MSKRRATEADYEDMAASYEAEPPREDEVLSVEISPAYLPMGRPTKGAGRSAGKTPALPVRLPNGIRSEMKRRVDAGTIKSESELVRAALVEYFERHPVDNTK